MATFCIALLLLVVGYFVYGGFVERVFAPDSGRVAPCFAKGDGADFIPMPTWKVYTVQFLNIAGTGPIFGALMGVLYGPAAFLWIVFGCLIGGAMHDYMSGMISMRRSGASLPEIIGDELGGVCRLLMRVVSLVLMVCVGASFTLIPAGLMDQLTSQIAGIGGTYVFWVVAMMAFYVCVTVFSVSKIMGNIYPIFGVALLLMALLVGVGVFVNPGDIPSISSAFSDHYPTQMDSAATPLFPALFITIACGAVSGFHATQSPMMARCLKNEKYGLRCFYGAMVTEGVVALIWAAAAIKFVDAMDMNAVYGTVREFATPYEKLYYAMTHTVTNGEVHVVKMNPALVVNMICNDWLGRVGLVLAVLGIVAAPMSTGGSAFRAARLICADFSSFGQKSVWRRVLLSVPLFALAIVMINVGSFKLLWLYVSWLNQVLATFTFYTIAHYLRREWRGPEWAHSWRRHAWLISFVPAVFMCAVSACFILIDKTNGLGVSHGTGYVAGIGFAAAVAIIYLINDRRK